MPIAPEIGSAALSAGASALGSIINAFTGSHQRKQALRDSKAMMNYQNEINLKNWRLQNKYNAPSAQLERLRAAGLNPSLHGIDGSTIPMQSVGLAENSAALTAGSNRQAALSGMLDASSQMANIALLKAQKENIDADTANKKADNPRIQYESSSDWLQERFYQSWWNNEHSALAADLAQIINSRERFRSQYFPYYQHSGQFVEMESDFTRMFDDVSTELDNLKKEGKLKEAEVDALSKTAHASLMSAAASLKQAEVADSRKEYQNALDDAVKSFQELRTEMLRLGFNESDGIGSRIIKKIAESLGMSFGIDSDLKYDPEFRSKHRQNRF